MILRRPYAFLIKNFKKIHFLLSLLSVYIIVKTSAIHSFFNLYVKNSYSAVITSNFKSKFLTSYLYMSIFIMIGFIFLIIFLLSYKNKKQKVYTVYLIYYILLIFAFLYLSTIFTTMENDVISPDFARLIRDLSLILYLPQIYFIIILSIRSIGFNVKQFEFGKDFKELEISETDSEEIEFNPEFDSYKAMRFGRRFFREFIYYVKENLFVFSIITTVVLFSFIKLIYSNITFETTTLYKLHTPFNHRGLVLTLKDSMVTKYDLGGNVIKKNSYYLAVQVEVKNLTGKDYKFDHNMFKLYNLKKNKVYNPDVTISNKFTDLGTHANKQLLKYNQENSFVIPYEIDPKDIKDNFEIRIFKNIVFKNDVGYPINSKVRLKPDLIESILIDESKDLKEILVFSNSYVGNSSIVINDYEIGRQYMYKGENCHKETCKEYQNVISLSVVGNEYLQTYLILDGKIDLDKSTDYYKNNKVDKLFLNNFTSIEYEKDGVMYQGKIDYDAASILSNKIILKVPREVENSEKLTLKFNIRNKIFKYHLLGM